MQIASVDWSVGTILRVYLYVVFVLLLGMSINRVQVMSETGFVDDRPVYGTVLYNSVGRCFDVNDPRMMEAKRIFQVGSRRWNNKYNKVL